MKTFLSALLPLALFAAAASAAPADDLSRVEVTGQKAHIERHDVRQACPTMDVALRNKLGGAWFKEQAEGLMTVHFQLDGGEVSAVKTSGFSMSYRQTRDAVRRAVSNLDCKADAPSQQSYAFQILFKAPGEGEDRFAISEIRVAAE